MPKDYEPHIDHAGLERGRPLGVEQNLADAPPHCDAVDAHRRERYLPAGANAPRAGAVGWRRANRS